MADIEVIVIDSSTNDNGALATDRTIHPGAVPAGSVQDMVTGVLARVGPHNRISRLILWGHGQSGAQSVGDGQAVASGPQSAFLGFGPHGHLLSYGALRRLRGHFAPHAVVELHGCRVGEHHAGRELIRQLSSIWLGVRVRAAILDQPSDRPNRYFGPVVEATCDARGRHCRAHRSSVGVPATTAPIIHGRR